ncbi:MAG: phage head morphosis protein family [Candidatus Saccharibacteria bacterium]|nr:phage head morphosis protein family [Candidatus Saccharibacteria bacterium]
MNQHYICDEVKNVRRDPTRTGDIRRSFYADLQRRGAELKRRVSATLKEMGEPQSSARSADEKLRAFEAVLISVIDRTLYQAGGAWATRYVTMAWDRGTNHAATAMKQTVAQKREAYEVQAQLLRKDLEGLSLTIEQSAVRLASVGFSRNLKSLAVSRDLGHLIDTAIKKRGTLIIAHHVVSSHAEATLDAAETLGIEFVRRVPEWKPKDAPKVLTDAAPGPVRLNDSRARYVKWVTAGDDRVCPTCAQMEDEILKISDARRMIPVHPNCRCSWQLLTRGRIREEFGTLAAGLAAAYILGVVGDAAWDENKHPRNPAGSSAGGEFASGGGAVPKKTFKEMFPRISSDDEVLVLKSAHAALGELGVDPSDFLERMTKGLGDLVVGAQLDSGGKEFHLRMIADLTFGHRAEMKFGKIARDIDLSAKTVEHAYFSLPENAQSGGRAREVLRSEIELYKQMGLKKVILGANINVGAYAWAKYGFLPESDRYWAMLSKMMVDKLKEVPDGEKNAGLVNWIKKLSEPSDRETLWDLVDDEETKIDGQTIGRHLLTGPNAAKLSWDGELDLNDVNQMNRFNHYIGKKK